jgi:RimJ/RimL family protein N-acetyltransferase
LIGLVGGGRNAETGVFEIGYWIAPVFWGQGIATEAAGAFKQHLIKTFGVQLLTADHFEDNPASGRVLSKLGFVETGRGEDFCLGRDTMVPVVHMAWTAQPAEGGRHE